MDKKVFIHCHAGTGRTGTVIAAYLLTSQRGMTPEQARTLIRAARPGSLPQQNQLKFLKQFVIWLRQARLIYPEESTVNELLRK